mmetsp:Transcript_2187/g.3228  ORF Transcript_2187/g.3228 Transcript_2187/m.3228 type:complete len:94 (-) Transcript_2187:71-352(-)
MDADNAGANTGTLRPDSKTEEKKDDDEDEDDAGNKYKKKNAISPAAKECISNATTGLGHITRDKASLMTEEFDALFGVNVATNVMNTGASSSS